MRHCRCIRSSCDRIHSTGCSTKSQTGDRYEYHHSGSTKACPSSCRTAQVVEACRRDRQNDQSTAARGLTVNDPNQDLEEQRSCATSLGPVIASSPSPREQ